MLILSGFSSEHSSVSGHADTGRPLVVNGCGYQKVMTVDIETLRPSGRVDWQVIYIARGQGHFFLESRWISLREGHVVIYPPGSPQHYLYRHEDAAEAYWLHFTGHDAHSLMVTLGLDALAIHPAGQLSDPAGQWMQLITELRFQQEYMDMRTAGLLQALLCDIARNAHRQTVHPRDTGIVRVVEHMHTHYRSINSVAELAALSNLSPSRFAHNFAFEMGIPPMEYLKKVRMEKARELLGGTTLQVAEIASLTGFEDPLYFSRVFHRATGCSPRAWRQSQR